MGVLPRTETGRFAPHVQLELKIDTMLLSCIIDHKSTHHLKGLDKALLPVYGFCESHNTHVHKSLNCWFPNIVENVKNMKNDAILRTVVQNRRCKQHR